MFISLLFKDPRTFASILLLVIFSVCSHEFMHAWVALKMGDSTAADRGYLTMNPFRHMGIFSLVMLIFLGVTWGQVPIDPSNLPTRKKRIAVALAGVSSNAALAIIFTFLGFLVISLSPENIFAARMLLYGAILNVVLLVINLLPVPGFDGFRVLIEFLKFNNRKSRESANIIFFVIMLTLFFFIDKIFAAAETLIGFMLRLLISIRSSL